MDEKTQERAQASEPSKAPLSSMPDTANESDGLDDDLFDDEPAHAIRPIAGLKLGTAAEKPNVRPGANEKTPSDATFWADIDDEASVNISPSSAVANWGTSRGWDDKGWDDDLEHDLDEKQEPGKPILPPSSPLKAQSSVNESPTKEDKTRAKDRHLEAQSRKEDRAKKLSIAKKLPADEASSGDDWGW